MGCVSWHRLHSLELTVCLVQQGMLSIGAGILGSSHVIGLDMDADALQTACDNVMEFDDLSIGMGLTLLICSRACSP